MECLGMVVGEWYSVFMGKKTLIDSVHSDMYSNYGVRLGATDLRKGDEKHAVTLDIGEVFIHPQYNATTFGNNIAVIELKSAVQCNNKYICTVCLPSVNLMGFPNFTLGMAHQQWIKDDVYQCLATGWGRKATGNIASKTQNLLSTIVPWCLLMSRLLHETDQSNLSSQRIVGATTKQIPDWLSIVLWSCCERMKSNQYGVEFLPIYWLEPAVNTVWSILNSIRHSVRNPHRQCKKNFSTRPSVLVKSNTNLNAYITNTIVKIPRQMVRNIPFSNFLENFSKIFELSFDFLISMQCVCNSRYFQSSIGSLRATQYGVDRRLISLWRILVSTIFSSIFYSCKIWFCSYKIWLWSCKIWFWSYKIWFWSFKIWFWSFKIWFWSFKIWFWSCKIWFWSCKIWFWSFKIWFWSYEIWFWSFKIWFWSFKLW